MEFIFLAGGVIGGFVLAKITGRHSKIYGVIDVDHQNELCKVHITSAELSDRRSKKAVFKINHDVVLSREEQIL